MDIAILIINAGVAILGHILDITGKEIQNMVNVNAL
jgi:short-subunit dehydrogenase